LNKKTRNFYQEAHNPRCGLFLFTKLAPNVLIDMKLSLSLLFTLFFGFTSAQVSVKIAPDEMGKLSMASLYSEFKQELHASIKSGRILLYDSPSLSAALKGESLTDFLNTEEATLIPAGDDPWAEDWIDTVLVYEINPKDWISIRFEKNYLTVQYNEFKTAYISNKDLKKLNSYNTEMLENLQREHNPVNINPEFIHSYGNSPYDSFQSDLFQLIQSGKITSYTANLLDEPLTVKQFDTLFDQEEFVIIEDFETGEFTDERILVEFNTQDISGMALRYEFAEDKNGLQMNYTHIGFCFQPWQFEGNQTNVVMVWMNWEDVKKHLTEKEWLLFQKIICQTGQLQDQQELHFVDF